MHTYTIRFICENHVAELVGLYHLARVALAHKAHGSPYDRKLWAAREFSRAHPDVTETAAYKDLCGLVG